MPSSTSAQSHARSHALLLLQKLLNLRDSASPLTLVLDTLEQSGKPILREFMKRAQISKAKVIYISFATPRKPANIDVFVRARGKTAEALRSEIISHYPPGHTHKTLLIIDELNPLANTIPTDLALFLSSLITGPTLSLVTLYHTDIPLPLPPSSTSPYAPHPLAILSHLATAVLRASNLHHAIARQQARNRSQAEPGFGLDEGKEGVLVGLGSRNGGKVTAAANDRDAGPVQQQQQGLVLEMELRRRSGRAVAETFVLVPGHHHHHHHSISSSSPSSSTASPSKLYLLSDHPAFQDPRATTTTAHGNGNGQSGREEGEEGPESTFNLGLTEKQRRDREGIVLPYFDAQSDIGGAGEGGRILYEMGREDDFDDEEDEI